MLKELPATLVKASVSALSERYETAEVCKKNWTRRLCLPTHCPVDLEHHRKAVEEWNEAVWPLPTAGPRDRMDLKIGVDCRDELHLSLIHI